MKTHTHPRDGDTTDPEPSSEGRPITEKPDPPDSEAPSEPEAAALESTVTETEEPEDTEESEAAEPETEEPEAKEPETGASEAAKKPESEGTQEAGAEKSDNRRTAALVLATVALLCAAWFGWSWYGAAHDDSLRYSETRDEVLRAGEQAVLNLNTLDYRNLNPSLKLWQDSSTSELYQQIVQGRAAFEREVRNAKTITSAKVLDAAVTELDEHSGKAGVIVGIQITVTPPQGEPVIKKTRLMGELTRTATGWKLSALAPAPAGSTG